MYRRNGWATALLLAWPLVTTVGTCPTFAQDKTPSAEVKNEASRRFKAGVAAFKKQRYEEAADNFEQAYALAPHAMALWNAADARDKQGANAKAANLYARYLELPDLKDKERKEAQSRLLRLSSLLAKLEVDDTNASDITVDNARLPKQGLYVEPGDHVVDAMVDGHAVKKALSLAAGTTRRLRLERPPQPKASASAPPPPPPKPLDAKKPVGPTLFYVGLGVTTVLVGTTIWSGLDTNSKRSDFDSNPTAKGYDDGKAAQDRTNLLIGATALAGVATAVYGLFIVDWKKPQDHSLSVGLGSAVWQTRF